MSDSPSPAGAYTVLLNQRAATAPYHREVVEIQGDEHPGMAIGFDADGVLGAIAGGGSTSVLVTGSDGAEYEKTTYADGAIRYKSLYESVPGGVVPGEAPEFGTTLVTGSDGADYEMSAYIDGTIRYKATYETLP